MPSSQPRPSRKRANRYHHGDLRRALIQAAVRTIDRHGVEALTLRAAGDTLGVSRTALYRHFRDKSSLLAAVAAEGFRALRAQLIDAWDQAGGGRAGFAAMGRAYVRFAIGHPSYYRVMFGRFKPEQRCESDLEESGAAAFQALIDALATLQEAGLVRRDDVRTQASFVWAAVHGVAMLAIDRQLGPEPSAGDALAAYAIDALGQGLMAPTQV